MGFGDDLMASGEASRLIEQHPNAQIVIGEGPDNHYWSDIFVGNPYVKPFHSIDDSKPVLWLRNYPSARPYIEKITDERIFFRKYKPIPGSLYFLPEELRWSRSLSKALGNFCIIEPNVKAKTSSYNKQLPIHKWQQVVDAFHKQISFVQFDYGMQILDNVHIIKARHFRYACGLLSHATCVVCPEGGMHHAAAALNVPAVVVFGGFISPDQTGYDGHINIYYEHALSPCGLLGECDHCKEAMRSISVDTIVGGIKEILYGEKGSAEKKLRRVFIARRRDVEFKYVFKSLLIYFGVERDTFLYSVFKSLFVTLTHFKWFRKMVCRIYS